MRSTVLHRAAAALAAAALAAALFTGCGGASGAASSESASTAPSAAASSESASAASSESGSESAAEDQIQVLFTVNYADGTSEEFQLEAQAGETLASALAAAGLISAEEAEAGFVTEVNGVLADFSKDQSWWCLTDASGEATTVGVGDIRLQDGDAYAFTYTK